MDPPQAGPTQLINPKCTKPYYTKPVEPIEKWGHIQCRYPSASMPYPANQPQVYRALLHQTSRTYWEIRRPLLIKPKCTQPYYTKPVKPIEKWGGPPLIKPKCTEPYYNKPVEPIEKWGGPLPLINSKCTQPYYTKPVELIEKWGGPPLIESKCTELYYTKPVDYWEMRRPSPANRPQVYWAILHQICFTYSRMPLVPPANQAQLYRAPLHQICFTYRRMPMAPH